MIAFNSSVLFFPTSIIFFVFPNRRKRPRTFLFLIFFIIPNQPCIYFLLAVLLSNSLQVDSSRSSFIASDFDDSIYVYRISYIEQRLLYCFSFLPWQLVYPCTSCRAERNEAEKGFAWLPGFFYEDTRGRKKKSQSFESSSHFERISDKNSSYTKWNIFSKTKNIAIIASFFSSRSRCLT